MELAQTVISLMEMAPYYLLDFFNTISSEEIESEYTRKTKALEIKRREAMALEHQQQSDALVLELSNLLQDEVSVSASENGNRNYFKFRR